MCLIQNTSMHYVEKLVCYMLLAYSEYPTPLRQAAVCMREMFA
jgi:hypothetical protein